MMSSLLKSHLPLNKTPLLNLALAAILAASRRPASSDLELHAHRDYNLPIGADHHPNRDKQLLFQIVLEEPKSLERRKFLSVFDDCTFNGRNGYESVA